MIKVVGLTDSTHWRKASADSSFGAICRGMSCSLPKRFWMRAGRVQGARSSLVRRRRVLKLLSAGAWYLRLMSLCYVGCLGGSVRFARGWASSRDLSRAEKRYRRASRS
jgi:hypothetical protein